MVVSYSLAYDAADIMDNDNLATVLKSQIQISIVLIGIVRKPSVEPSVSAKRWRITPEKVQKTIQATMQIWIRTMLHSLLSRLFRMNDQNLHYHHLAHPIFSDMMFLVQCPEGGNRCAQVYATDFGWVRAFPVTPRSEEHETLLLLFPRNGVSPACTCDNAKEMVQDKFYQKLKDAACHLKQWSHILPGQMLQRERD